MAKQQFGELCAASEMEPDAIEERLKHTTAAQEGTGPGRRRTKKVRGDSHACATRRASCIVDILGRRMRDVFHCCLYGHCARAKSFELGDHSATARGSGIADNTRHPAGDPDWRGERDRHQSRHWAAVQRRRFLGAQWRTGRRADDFRSAGRARPGNSRPAAEQQHLWTGDRDKSWSLLSRPASITPGPCRSLSPPAYRPSTSNPNRWRPLSA